MKLTSLLLVGAVSACTAQAQIQPAGPPPPQPAPAPVVVRADKHPAYIHALQDLRVARSYLQRPAGIVVKWDENRAIREIDAAISEIKRAAIDDGKPLDERPPADTPTWGGRLDRSIELLSKAQADINGEEDSPSSEVHRLRGVASQHISNAINFVKEGIEEQHASAPPPPPPPVVVAPAPSQHPAYIHAMADLRTARAWLARPAANADVKWDENRAIGEINAALREIREAAIDDGKPVEEVVATDTHMRHHDRLKKAIELLAQAARDIEEKEDNNFAKGLRRRAVEHIRKAERDVRDAIHDR